MTQTPPESKINYCNSVTGDGPFDQECGWV